MYIQDAALMRRVLLGEADEAEQQELEKRLEECSDLRKIYEQLQNSETLKAAFKERQNYSSKKAYQSFLQKIGQVEPGKTKTSVSSHRVVYCCRCRYFRSGAFFLYVE